MPDYKIEPLTKNNIEEVILFDKECFSEDYFERKESYLNFASNYPKGALLFYCKKKIAGALFFHPYLKDQIHELNSTEIKFSGNENCMYLHSFSIHPDFRGKGLAYILFDHFNKISLAEGYNLQAGVAVQDSERFWMKLGFKPIRQIRYGNALCTYITRKIVS